MSRIKRLPQVLIDQIAAGEVVERPASVVKELVENSLDAGADQISVRIWEGGLRKIVVLDNGLGMDEADARECFLRHSTSKLDEFQDLFDVETFGFRGEALSSIASVSRITLKTKSDKADKAVEVFIEGGNEPQVKTGVFPQGTMIEVADLFYNIPARRKFLKSVSTEFRHIRSFVLAQSLIYPEVSFVLEHNEREIINLPGGQTWQDRISSALQWDLDQFVSLEAETDFCRISGYSGLPVLFRQRVDQYLFVNHRFLQNRTVWGAIKKGYEGVMPGGMSVPFILKIDLRPDLLDVNVHPRKEEVKFINSSLIFNTISQAVKSSLSRSLTENSLSEATVSQDSAIFRLSDQSSQELSPFPSGFAIKDNLSSEKKKTETSLSPIGVGLRQIEQKLNWPELGGTMFEPPQRLTVLQLAKLYLILLEEDGLLIFDQHALEEKIIFEELVADWKEQQSSGKGQELLFSLEIEITEEEREILSKYHNVLESVGFRFEERDNKLIINSVPAIIKDRDIKQVISGFLDDLLSHQDLDLDLEEIATEFSLDHQTVEILHFLSCRSAVKQGDVLSPARRERLIQQGLALKQKGISCPHGRPTWVKIKLKDLHKMFKRE